ncbi:MAG: DNA/RNA non-specific endonuclease [Chromatiales bacterium]|nr:DNA/RNA non-specific endonuclease [Chromatiales bacterium]
MDSFAVLHSGESKTPVYVAERLNRARLIDAQDEERTDKFYEEARLPSAHRARLADYKGSGYDRGHMAPAADMPNPKAMAQSFSPANMVPQAQNLNRGIWAKNIEKPIRQYAMRAKGDVFVFTGPVFSGKPETIGAGQVWVPSQLYKLVYDAAENRAWAYWVDNRDEARMSRPISYEELVKRTGIEFLPGIRPRLGGGAVAGSAPSEPAPVAKAEPTSRTTAECGSKRTCKQMSDCAEARYYLTACGVTSLDGDGDGVPCEALCR